MYEESYDEAVDVYAFGMCMLEMATSEYPYNECLGPAQIYKKVVGGIKPVSFEKIENPEVKDIIDRCTKLKKTDRPSCLELLNSDFFSEDLGIKLEPITKQQFLINPTCNKIEFRLRLMDPKKRTSKHKENEAIQFDFDITTDNANEIASEMFKSNIINEDDSKAVSKLIQVQVSALIKQRREMMAQHQLDLQQTHYMAKALRAQQMLAIQATTAVDEDDEEDDDDDDYDENDDDEIVDYIQGDNVNENDLAEATGKEDDFENRKEFDTCDKLVKDGSNELPSNLETETIKVKHRTGHKNKKVILKIGQQSSLADNETIQREKIPKVNVQFRDSVQYEHEVVNQPIKLPDDNVNVSVQSQNMQRIQQPSVGGQEHVYSEPFLTTTSDPNQIGQMHQQQIVPQHAVEAHTQEQNQPVVEEFRNNITSIPNENIQATNTQMEERKMIEEPLSYQPQPQNVQRYNDTEVHQYSNTDVAINNTQLQPNQNEIPEHTTEFGMNVMQQQQFENQQINYQQQQQQYHQQQYQNVQQHITPPVSSSQQPQQITHQPVQQTHHFTAPIQQQPVHLLQQTGQSIQQTLQSTTQQQIYHPQQAVNQSIQQPLQQQHQINQQQSAQSVHTNLQAQNVNQYHQPIQSQPPQQSSINNSQHIIPTSVQSLPQPLQQQQAQQSIQQSLPSSQITDMQQIYQNQMQYQTQPEAIQTSQSQQLIQETNYQPQQPLQQQNIQQSHHHQPISQDFIHSSTYQITDVPNKLPQQQIDTSNNMNNANVPSSTTNAIQKHEIVPVTTKTSTPTTLPASKPIAGETKTRRSNKSSERIPKLVILSVKHGTLVDCSMENKLKTIKFKFDISDVNPIDVANDLVIILKFSLVPIYFK